MTFEDAKKCATWPTAAAVSIDDDCNGFREVTVVTGPANLPLYRYYVYDRTSGAVVAVAGAGELTIPRCIGGPSGTDVALCPPTRATYGCDPGADASVD